MLIKGDTASYTQYGGQVTVGTKLSILADRDADFYAATGFQFDAPKPKTTVTNGALIVQGRDADYYQMEGEVTTKTGLSVVATEDAFFLTEERFQNEDPVTPGLFDSAAGAKTTVTAGKLTVQGVASAGYFQSEGEASFAAGVSIVSSQGSASFETDVGDGYDSVGPKTTSTGALIVQGLSTGFIQTGGQATFPTGISLLGRDGAQFLINTGETHNIDFDFFDVPADTTVATGPVLIRGGTGDVQVGVFGDEFSVGKDLTVFGPGHNRISFEGDTGTTIGGKLSVTGATADHDWFIVGSNFSVAGNATVALGAGANFIDLGGDGGVVSVGGNLNLTTGNGSDEYILKSVTVTGTTTITTGAGTDRLSILGAATFTGAVNVDLGGGADTAAIANEAGSTGPVTFNGPSRIKFGAGNDTAILGLAVTSGGDTNSRVAVGGSGFLTLDGGRTSTRSTTRSPSSM